MYSPLLLIKGSHTKLTSSMPRTNLKSTPRVKRLGTNSKPGVSKRAMANYQKAMRMDIVQTPAAKSAVIRPGNNRIYTEGSRVMVCNTEVLVNSVAIAAAGAAVIVTNPLIPSNLPWLNGVAQNYSQWRWRSLTISYIPFCSTSTSGRFGMGLSFDAGDTTASTLAQVLQLDRSVMAPVWGKSGASLEISVPIEKLFGNNYRYITLANYAALPSNTDRNVYCPVLIQYGTDSGVAGTVGTIMASYEIELLDPIVASLNV